MGARLVYPHFVATDLEIRLGLLRLFFAQQVPACFVWQLRQADEGQFDVRQLHFSLCPQRRFESLCRYSPFSRDDHVSAGQTANSSPSAWLPSQNFVGLWAHQQLIYRGVLRSSSSHSGLGSGTTGCHAGFC